MNTRYLPMKNILKEGSSNITDLHESVLIQILTFIPIQYIIRCRCVCKSWASLITQPFFIEFYDSCGRAPVVQFLVLDKLSKPNNLFLAQLDEASCTTKSPMDFLVPSKLLQLSLKSLDPFYTLNVFSTCRVTGCIGASYTCKEGAPLQDGCHIFNPLTGHHILVERTETTRGSTYYRWEEDCALVFAQKTNKLKLVLFTNNWHHCKVSVDLQTIGTNLWRFVGKFPFRPINHTLPAFANGLYHWLGEYSNEIYSFDADEEVFEKIETPCIKNSYGSNLGILNDCLCICIELITSKEIWVRMSENNGDHRIYSWTKKFVIDRDDWIWSNKVLHPLKYLENVGEIVMLCFPISEAFSRSKIKYSKAICYNPSTGAYKHIRFAAGEDSTKYKNRIFPYTPSLRSVLPAPTD